jgi:hypothetical protein
MAVSTPDPYGKHLRRLSRQMVGISRSLDVNRSLNKSMAPVVKAIQQLKPLSPNLLEQVRRMAEVVRDEFQRTAPPNWPELDFGLWRDAIALGTDHGINVLWAPRTEIIRQLIDAADESGRSDILLTREADILNEVDDVLAGVTLGRFGHLPDLARKAVAAQLAGHPEAGQALASAVMTGVVERVLGIDGIGKARRSFHESSPWESGAGALPLRTILYTLGRALHRMDEAPPGFNRNSSAHGHPTQYTRVNATISMLMMAGLLGELQRFLADQDSEAGNGAAAA